MSVVVTQVTNEEIILGVDSCITYGGEVQLAIEKLQANPKVVIGGAGNPEHISLFQIFSSRFTPEGDDPWELVEYVSEFYDFLAEHNLSVYAESGDDVLSHFHMIYNGRVWHIEGLYVREVTEYDVLGSGDNFARTALYLGHTVEEALDASCQFSSYCDYPIHVLRVPKNVVSDYHLLEIKTIKHPPQNVVSNYQILETEAVDHPPR